MRAETPLGSEQRTFNPSVRDSNPRGPVTIRVREDVFSEGTGEVTCDVRDTPHTWGVLLRCNQEELDAFQALPAEQYLLVDVGGGRTGRAQLAAREEPGHVRLTGRGFCPYPHHDRGEGPAGLPTRLF